MLHIQQWDLPSKGYYRAKYLVMRYVLKRQSGNQIFTLRRHPYRCLCRYFEGLIYVLLRNPCRYPYIHFHKKLRYLISTFWRHLYRHPCQYPHRYPQSCFRKLISVLLRHSCRHSHRYSWNISSFKKYTSKVSYMYDGRTIALFEY